MESVDDVRWVADRAPGKPLLCAIESAKGVVNALRIAEEPSVTHLALGGIDLQKDLRVASAGAPLDYVRSHLVVAARAAGIEPPIDSVYPHIHDDDGLRSQAMASRSLGLFGKSAVHPAQLPTIHAAFGSTTDEVRWARAVLEAFFRIERRSCGPTHRGIRGPSGRRTSACSCRESTSYCGGAQRVSAPWWRPHH